MSNDNVIFPEIDTLISHLKFLKKDKLTPIRLQKALYFLFAFYGASYGQLTASAAGEGSFEGTEEDAYPKYLFEEQFQAWKFGPVIPTVYHDFKNNEIEANEWIANNPKEDNVKHLIEEVMTQLDEMGDFELVERTHEDSSWKSIYRNGQGQSEQMDSDDIIEEYRTTVD